MGGGGGGYDWQRKQKKFRSLVHGLRGIDRTIDTQVVVDPQVKSNLYAPQLNVSTVVGNAVTKTASTEATVEKQLSSKTIDPTNHESPAPSPCTFTQRLAWAVLCG